MPSTPLKTHRFMLMLIPSLFMGCSSNSDFDQEDIEAALTGYAWDITSMTSDQPTDYNGDGFVSENVMDELNGCTMTFLFCELFEMEVSLNGADCTDGFSALGGWHVQGKNLITNRIVKGTDRVYQINELEENKFTATEHYVKGSVSATFQYTFEKNNDFQSAYGFLDDCRK